MKKVETETDSSLHWSPLFLSIDGLYWILKSNGWHWKLIQYQEVLQNFLRHYACSIKVKNHYSKGRVVGIFQGTKSSHQALKIFRCEQNFFFSSLLIVWKVLNSYVFCVPFFVWSLLTHISYCLKIFCFWKFEF